MQKLIPNIFTLFNLFCGLMIISLSVRGDYNSIALWALLALVSDFLDGFMARLLKVQSKIGAQLDSLSDLVSFGVAPAMVLYYFLENDLYESFNYWIFVIPLFAAYRLAKFNVESQSTHYFKGIATPAFAIFCFSIPLITTSFAVEIFHHTIFLKILIILGCILLVTNLKFFSLKPDFSDKQQTLIQIIFMVVSIILVVVFGYLGVTLSFIWYLFFSLIIQKKIT